MNYVETLAMGTVATPTVGTNTWSQSPLSRCMMVSGVGKYHTLLSVIHML